MSSLLTQTYPYLSHPTEVRVVILQQAPDLITLHDLVLTCRSNLQIFNRFHYDIFDRVIVTNFVPEIRDIVLKIREKLCCYSLSSDERIEFRINAPRGAKFEQYYPIDQVAVFFKLAEMAKTVEDLTRSFAEQRILIPSGQRNGQASPAELHRIRRAFWRFLLFFLIQSKEDTNDVLNNAKGGRRYLSHIEESTPDAGEQWLRPRSRSPHQLIFSPGAIQPPYACGLMEDWEIQEFDAVRGFLREEVNRIQYDRYHMVDQPSFNSSDILHIQPVLIRQIIEQLEHWPMIPDKYMEDHPLIACIEWSSYHRLTDVPKWPESPSGTRATSVNRNEADIIKRQQTRTESWNSGCFCMWERRRLEQANLLLSDTIKPSDYPKQPTRCLEDLLTAYEHCAMVVNTDLDGRIKALYSAGVELMKRKSKQALYLKKRRDLLNWVEYRDSALFEKWKELLTTGDFGIQAEDQENLCAAKAHIMKALEESTHGETGESSEQADLNLLKLCHNCMSPLP